ncbi:MAG: hypothetical protein QM783_13295 [Phycisphaerales bacterium]
MTNDLDRRFLLGGLAGAAGVSALAAMTSRAHAGPLNPPAGAVAATGKTLPEIEPRTPITDANTPGTANVLFRITQPGSYYLTGNILGFPGKSGVLIAADNVTLDLNGFALLGVPGSGDGIAGNDVSNVTVLNGVCKGWGATGVSFYGSAVQGIRIHGVTAANNVNGIYVDRLAEISGCIALNNTVTGIEAGNSSVVTGCTCCGNANGIRVGNNAWVEGNTVAGAAAWAGEGTGPGAEGIRARIASTIVGNNVRSFAIGYRQAAAVSGEFGLCRIENNQCLSCNTAYKIEGTSNMLRSNTSALAAAAHFNIAANNMAKVVVATMNGAAFTNTGGTSILPTGADTNTNLILA